MLLCAVKDVLSKGCMFSVMKELRKWRKKKWRRGGGDPLSSCLRSSSRASGCQDHRTARDLVLRAAVCRRQRIHHMAASWKEGKSVLPLSEWDDNEYVLLHHPVLLTRPVSLLYAVLLKSTLMLLDGLYLTLFALLCLAVPYFTPVNSDIFFNFILLATPLYLFYPKRLYIS